MPYLPNGTFAESMDEYRERLGREILAQEVRLMELQKIILEASEQVDKVHDDLVDLGNAWEKATRSCQRRPV